MKKDFSQAFDRESLDRIEVIVQDSVSKRYLLLISTEEHEEDFCHVLSMKLADGKELSLELTRFLFENHLVLNHFREIDRQTSVSFSFSDDTPGAESTSICLYANVDIIDKDRLSTETESASFVDLPELLNKLSASFYTNPVLEHGVAKLLIEDIVLGKITSVKF